MLGNKIAAVSLLGFLVCASSTRARADTVYVESNRGDANSLLGFNLSAAGALTPASSVPTAGKGIVDPSLALGPFDSDQEIIVNPEHTLLFAVNTGSNSVAVFNIGAAGDLSAVVGSPFDSHGVGPVSLGLEGDVLTVVNKHGDPAQAADNTLPNYTSFHVCADGQLEWTGAKVEVANGSSPSQSLVSPFAPLVFGADFLGGLLRSFGIDDQGAIHSHDVLGLPDSAFTGPAAGAPHLPLGLAANPLQALIYVGFPTANKIGVYGYDGWGALSLQNIVADSGNVVCWLRTNREGTRLYASNTADPSITVYDIATDPFTPRELQKLVLPSMGGSYQIELTPDETQLVVLTERFQATVPQGKGNEMHILEVSSVDGTVQEAAGSPTALDLPTDVRPQGIAVF